MATIFGFAAIGALMFYLLWHHGQLAPDLVLKSSLPKPPPPPPWYFAISDPPRGRMAWRPQNVPEIVRPPWKWGDTTDPLCCVAPTAVRNRADDYGWHVLRVADAEERLVHRVRPNYPNEAKAAGLQGVVKLDVVIGEGGKPLLIGVLSGSTSLAQAAVAAVKKWRYKPLVVNGKAQKVQIIAVENFTLE